MRRPLIRRLALAAAALVVCAASTSPSGLWLTQDGEGVIRIEPCGSGICGTVLGTSTPSQCRLTIMNLAPQRDGAWSGHITNPDDGTVWNARIRLDERGRLLLRGYIGVPLLGRTQVWTRYTGRLTDDCRMVSS